MKDSETDPDSVAISTKSQSSNKLISLSIPLVNSRTDETKTNVQASEETIASVSPRPNIIGNIVLTYHSISNDRLSKLELLAQPP